MNAISVPTRAQYYFDVPLLQGILLYVSATYVAIFREVSEKCNTITKASAPFHYGQ